MYLEHELSYCFTPVGFVKYKDQRQWNQAETETSYRLAKLAKFGNAFLRSQTTF